MNTKHIPVLKNQILELVDPKSGQIVVDATLGGAGHLQMFINKAKTGTFIGFDQDKSAIDKVKKLFVKKGFEVLSDHQGVIKMQLEETGVILVHDNFENLKIRLKQLEVMQVNAILADLGTSQDQIEDESRGFSFKTDAKLDMRMDSNLRITAADLINGLTEKELVELFTKLADLKKEAKELAKRIVESRKSKPVLTTKDLKTLIYQAVPSSRGSRTNRHLNTNLEARVFQALRIAVNHELDSLRRFLPQALETLKAQGRLLVISFHSGEDRIVKNFITEMEKQKKINVIEKLIGPNEEEIAQNPRSSSAKLRVIEKL